MAANTSRSHTSFVIDLTGDEVDDDNNDALDALLLRDYPQVNIPQIPRLPRIPDFVSHDGLPKFPSTSTSNSTSRPYTILPEHAHSLVPQLGGLSVPNPSTYRQRTGQTSSSTSSTSSADLESLENPSKRRKTSADTHIRSTEILPPAPKYHRTSLPLSDRAKETAKTPTVISGASRAEYSQLPRVSFNSDSKLGAGSDCLTKQVFPHIKDALGQHRDTLTKLARTSIGTKVSRILVLDPKFYDEVLANNGMLSKEYENQLAVQASAEVHNLATQAQAIPNSEASGNTTANIHKTTPRHWPSHPILSTAISETQSSDGDEIFEDRRKTTNLSVPKPSEPPRKYSSSPTTSYSNDPTDGEKLEDPNDTQQPRRSGRKITLVLKPHHVRWPVRHRVPNQKPKSHAKAPWKYKNEPTQESIPEFQQSDIDVVLQRQNLQYAARDTNAPRPYLRQAARRSISDNIELRGHHLGKLSHREQVSLQLSPLHVDFCLEEMKVLLVIIMNACQQPVKRIVMDSDLPKTVMLAMRGRQSIIPKILKDLNAAKLGQDEDLSLCLLRRRDDVAITSFLQDAADWRIALIPRVVRLKVKPTPEKKITTRSRPRLASLLMQREVHGMTPHRIRKGQVSFKAIATSYIEDSLARKSEFTDCCGDITTITWASKISFICGTTAHSDLHNMQYNKPGNLALGSTLLDTLRSVSNHRIKRPVVATNENVENSLDSMRQTQSPWLYTSVVSTAYSVTSGLTFTASFDQTVKVWTVSESGDEMDLRGAWYHDGKVNFVITSEHHDRVATASDVIHDAVRVYSLNKDNIPQTSFEAYGGNRAQEQGVELEHREKWAYFPATIQWGKIERVSHLLLVGYSPRSLTQHELEIPEDKQNTGELCLWDTDNGTKVLISSGKSQNVFEVLWHPSQPIFAAATSPSGSYEPQQTKTQIRLFAQNEYGTFYHLKVFDCPAMDINELTIMPNSTFHSFVTASCTDGKTYVYDSARGDQAIHILKHGESLDNPTHDLPRELADTGVKFAAWGHTKSRFYTGASDGKVKVWDVTAPPKEAFVRDMLTVSGGISAGAFSEDSSQLVVGDSTGKIHLIGYDDNYVEVAPTKQARQYPVPPLQGRHQLQRGGLLPAGIKRPKVLIPHKEPIPPKGQDDIDIESGVELGRSYIEEGHIVLAKDPSIGAVQGVNYHETGLYRLEAHLNQDGTKPLHSYWQEKQQFEVRRQEQASSRLPILPQVKSSDLAAHMKNLSLNFNVDDLTPATRVELQRDRVEFKWEKGYKLRYDVFPGRAFEIFKSEEEELRERKQSTLPSSKSSTSGSDSKSRENL